MQAGLALGSQQKVLRECDLAPPAPDPCAAKIARYGIHRPEEKNEFIKNLKRVIVRDGIDSKQGRKHGNSRS